MSFPKIVVFTGKMGSGKTTATDIFKDIILKNERYYTIQKLAAPIYDIADNVSRILDIPFDKNKFRGLMQFVGTEFGRKALGEDFWIDLWVSRYNRLCNLLLESTVYICDDCRFDNEAKKFKEIGALIIEIKSTEENVIKRGLSTQNNNHESEKGIDTKLISMTLENNGSKEELKAKLEELYSFLDTSSDASQITNSEVLPD